MQYFEKEVDLYPEVAIVHTPLANAYWKLGKEKQALEVMRRSTELAPDAIARWREYGRMAKGAGLADESRRVNEHIKRLLLTVPSYRDALSANNEAIQSIQANDIESALEMHAFAIEHYPGSPEAWYNFAVTLHRVKKSDLAVQYYSRAIELNPEMTLAHFNRGLLTQSVDPEAAQLDFEATIRSDPEHTLSRIAAFFIQYPALSESMGEMMSSLHYVM